MEEKNKKLQQEKSDSKRSYNTVSKMFAGIVLEKFEDNASRTSEVKSALERQGVEVDVKTIREHQNRGFTLIRNFKEETL